MNYDEIYGLCQSDLSWDISNSNISVQPDPSEYYAGVYLVLNYTSKQAGLVFTRQQTAEEIDYEDAAKEFTEV